MSDTSTEKYVSHEAVCVLNLTDEKAEINITIFFQDREPIEGFGAVCESKRTNHIRLDKIKNSEGVMIPHDVSYAILVESSEPVVCQHSRMDVSQPDMTYCTDEKSEHRLEQEWCFADITSMDDIPECTCEYYIEVKVKIGDEECITTSQFVQII